MKDKYKISCVRNRQCYVWMHETTNNIFVALWKLFLISRKYPIVIFEIDGEPIPCKECTAKYNKICNHPKEL